MADDSDNTASNNNQSTGADSEVTADWESAFQAEDYLISPDNENAGDFFEDGEANISEKGMPQSDSFDGREGASGIKGLSSGLFGKFFQRVGSNPFVIKFVGLLPAAIGKRLASKSSIQLGQVVCILILLMVVVFIAAFPGSVGKDADVVEQQDSSPTEKEAVAEQTSDSKLAGQQVSHAETKAESEMVAAWQEKNQSSSEISGIERRKWRFPAFMINASSQDNEERPSYVAIDLSLVMHLELGADLPEEKQYIIRDMIYQFYLNRPLNELRRFSLARGEMKQKLKAWLKKQWPEGQIDNILFHRYQII